MALKSKIQEDLKTALKEKKEVELSVLRMLLSALNSRETEKRTRIWKAKPSLKPEELEKESQLTDEDALDSVSNEIKKRREAMDLYEKGGRPELAEKEKGEMEILKKYLPEQIGEEEIRKLVSEAIKKTGAAKVQDMGKVMGVITAQLKGKADMSLVSKIVKDSLAE